MPTKHMARKCSLLLDLVVELGWVMRASHTLVVPLLQIRRSQPSTKRNWWKCRLWVLNNEKLPIDAHTVVSTNLKFCKVWRTAHLCSPLRKSHYVSALRAAALDFQGEGLGLVNLVVGSGRQGIVSSAQGTACNGGPRVGKQKVGSNSFRIGKAVPARTAQRETNTVDTISKWHNGLNAKAKILATHDSAIEHIGAVESICVSVPQVESHNAVAFSDAFGALARNGATIASLDMTSRLIVVGNGLAGAVFSDKVEDKVGKGVEILERYAHGLVHDVPIDNFRARRRRQGSLVIIC
jgi:hypothetical protein